MLSWSSDGSNRLESVRTVVTDRGLRANGYLIQGNEFAGSYSLLADAQGRTRRMTVQSDSAEGERHLALTRTPGGPWVVESTTGSAPLWALDAAIDADIDHSAFTNALSLRRLVLAGGGKVTEGFSTTVTVACITMPSLAVSTVEHRYTYRGGQVWTYQGPAGDIDLTVDEQNFVLDFPGLSHRLG